MIRVRTFTPSSVQIIEVHDTRVKTALVSLFIELANREDDPIVIGINIEHKDYEDGVLLTAFLDDCDEPQRKEKVPYA